MSIVSTDAAFVSAGIKKLQARLSSYEATLRSNDLTADERAFLNRVSASIRREIASARESLGFYRAVLAR